MIFHLHDNNSFLNSLSPPLPFLKLFSIAWVILSKHISSHVILLLKTPAVASHSVIADVLTKPVSPKGN